MNARGGMITNGLGMPVGDSQISLMSDCSGYGGGGRGGAMNLLDDANAGMTMDNSFRAALQGMASPPGSIQNSLHSTQHTLDFYSMHSMDIQSNHGSMRPPSSHVPTMSSLSRQQQIDERFPLQQQNMGLDMQSMNQSYRGQTLDGAPQPPRQSEQPRVNSMPPQIKNRSGAGDRGYNGIGMPKGSRDDLDPVNTFPQGYPVQQQQQQQPHRGGYSNQQEGSQSQGGYSEEQLSHGGYYDGEKQRRGASNSREYDQPVRTTSGSSQDEQHLMGPPDRYNQGQSRVVSSSMQGNQSTSGGVSGQSYGSNNSSFPNGTQPSVLGSSSRHKMDRRNIFAKMKFTRPASYRDNKMGMGGASTHSQVSTGDGMPDIHMVESQHSLHSTLSAMTDGNSAHLPNRSTRGSAWQERAPVDKGIAERASVDKGPMAERAPVDKGLMVERVPIVDHSSRSEYMDVLATGSRHSLMSGLSRISDHSANDASIFSSLSKAIGNVSTRSIAMSEISVIDVAEREGEDEPSSNHEEPTESHEEL